MIDDDRLRGYIIKVIKKMMVGSKMEKEKLSRMVGCNNRQLWWIFSKKTDITLVQFIKLCYFNNYNFVNPLEQVNRYILQEMKNPNAICKVNYCKYIEEIEFFDFNIEKDDNGDVKLITFFCYMPIFQSRFNHKILSDIIFHGQSRRPLFIDFKVFDPETSEKLLDIQSKCKVFQSEHLNENSTKIYAYDFLLIESDAADLNDSDNMSEIPTSSMNQA